MLRNSFNKDIVRIFCKCCCNAGIQFHFDVEMDESPHVFISFLCDAQSVHGLGPWTAFKDRMKMIWAILRGKEHCLHDVILPYEEWQEFYAKLTECNERMKEKYEQ